MTEKAPNYSDADTARLIEMYDPSATAEARTEAVDSLASELGKNKASVIAKLVTLKIYVKKDKAVAGKSITRKADMVGYIADLIGASEDVVGSLEKATKPALWLVIEALDPR